MSPPLSLVVLAAGLGSRYGGLKQLDPLGPGGSTLMDYSVYDAWRAGFSRVLFVLRPEMTQDFEEVFWRRYRSRLEVAVAAQRIDDLPASARAASGRTRPWGTTHAVLTTRPLITAPFAVLNADDCYGREAIETVAHFLRREDVAVNTQAVIGYRLAATASPAGGVNRARLDLRDDGGLRGVTELRGVVRSADGSLSYAESGGIAPIAPETLVSMNLWGFRPSIFPVLAREFEQFLASNPGDDGESYLPDAVQGGLGDGSIAVRVLPTASRWCGVTYPEDRGWVAAALRSMVEQGEYPEELWPS